MRKEKILIVDDSEMNRSILADMLSDSYEVLEAEDGVRAVALLSRQASELSLLLLDIVMPRLDGFGVLEAMKVHGWIRDLPVIVISAENSPSQVERAYELGVTDFITRPFDALIVRRRVVNTLLLSVKQKRLIDMVEEQVYEKERHSDLMIDILSHIMEFRNGESGLHILHVRTLTDLLLSHLTRRTDRYHLTMADIAVISTASALHDIGKMTIEEKILNKPGKLTPEEFEIMKTHAAAGEAMLREVPLYQDEPLVKVAREICRWHHERYDGRGYPDGLQGDEIPISAQVVAMADVYDALTSQRVYKPPFSHEQAVKMIVGGECGAFNPLLLACLEENAEEVRTALQTEQKDAIRSRKLQKISEETLRSEGGGASRRTLRLLDRERIRSSFYASMTETVQFEFNACPAMLTLSAWSARRLELDEIIMDPERDPRLRGILGEGTWERLARKLAATSPEQPEMRMDIPLRYPEGIRWSRVVMRSLWSDAMVPGLEGSIGIVIDIHDTRQRLQELEEKASLDALTGLLNRSSAREQIEVRLQSGSPLRFALALFDLDFFKSANDTCGHQFGDEVLKFVARRLRSSVRGSDICCRAGGDEFLLFLEYKTDIERTVERIFRSICGEYGGFRVSVTIGVALEDTAGRCYENLFRQADAALYSAKRAGRGRFCFYENSMENLLPAVES